MSAQLHPCGNSAASVQSAALALTNFPYDRLMARPA